ncbi:MAG TPA: hypothetical protein VGJ33_05950 [Candidatus Angelobacter sp.]|jgi:hypothetical protein
MNEAVRSGETSVPDNFFAELYDSAVASGTPPLEFHIFDAQLAPRLNFEWLCAQIPDKKDLTELTSLVQEGYIRKWPVDGGSYGFTLYSVEEFKFLKRLRDFKRYDDEELKYIAMLAQRDIDGTIEILPYDKLDESDLVSFRVRLIDLIAEEEHHIKWRTENNLDITEHQERLHNWQKWQSAVTEKEDTDLSERQRHKISRFLFQLRLIDEFVRIDNSKRFQSLVLQGYSPEVFFKSWEQQFGGEATFGKIDWHSTLETFKYSRAQGRRFPLRTPDFYLTENGIHFSQYLSPAAYLRIYDRYDLSELFPLIEQLGRDLWYPTVLRTDEAQCAGCGNSFRRTLSTKQYCSDKCRNRARGRRWRARDPERARMAQARYWRSYGEEEP